MRDVPLDDDEASALKLGFDKAMFIDYYQCTLTDQIWHPVTRKYLITKQS